MRGCRPHFVALPCNSGRTCFLRFMQSSAAGGLLATAVCDDRVQAFPFIHVIDNCKTVAIETHVR